MALLQDTSAPPPTFGAVAGPAVAGGSLAGFAGAVGLLAVTMTAAEVASQPTAKAGLETDAGTVPNAVTSFTFATGIEQWNGGYTWATYPGIAIVLITGAGLGIAGVLAITAVLGRRPSLGAAAVTGAIYGAFLHLVLLSGVIDGLQDLNGVHTAAPGWSWWLGNVAFGAFVGLAGGALLRFSRRAGEVAGSGS